MKQTREAQILTEPTYKLGSEGSRIQTNNPTKYPTLESLNEYPPKMTDHKFQADAIIPNGITDTSAELTRRQQNHARDCRTGNTVQDNEIYARS